jgi:YVTN family beta-propeller protein
LKSQSFLVAILFALAASASVRAQSPSAFVNWETPHVHPLDLTPDGTRLLAVNTADARLEVFDASGVTVAPLYSVPVGLDPVSVRARTNDEIWVVNHISDSVSIVSLSSRSVIRTLKTDDEPCDVVFAGSPARAWVSCSQANTVLVYDLANLAAAPARIAIEGEDPRAMAVSQDGSTVYVAIFESGNNTTILGGGAVSNLGFPPNVVNDPTGPYGGQNPPPNSGVTFNPPINGANPPAPAVGMIVRKNGSGRWKDDNNGDWTDLVSGPNASASGRPVGWDLADHDVAVIDTTSLGVSYVRGLMNLCMGIAVDPSNGDLTVIGTEATNEIRFEPNVKGRFTRVHLARVQQPGLLTSVITDLNSHLNYLLPTLPQAERDKSIGDPRGIAWNAAGTRAYVTGMGSNNVIVIDSAGARAGVTPTIEVGEGPTGIVLDAAHSRLLVLDKFEGAISVVDLSSETETARIPFHDASPAAIKNGRKHLYDTHKTSGLGQIACASCHVDARMDRLAWDLGDPSETMKPVAGQNLGAGLPGLNTGFQPWHPMKGPMTTQTLQDIIGKEPLHWRGDRDGLEEFNGAFLGLQGDDANLTPAEMQEFEDFLATIAFPPNPFRNFDNRARRCRRRRRDDDRRDAARGSDGAGCRRLRHPGVGRRRTGRRLARPGRARFPLVLDAPDRRDRADRGELRPELLQRRGEGAGHRAHGRAPGAAGTKLGACRGRRRHRSPRRHRDGRVRSVLLLQLRRDGDHGCRPGPAGRRRLGADPEPRAGQRRVGERQRPADGRRADGVAASGAAAVR